MNILSGLRTFRESFRPIPIPEMEREPMPRMPFSGTRMRTSVDNENFVQASLTSLAPLVSDSPWLRGDIDITHLDRLPPAKLLEVLADISPDISRALWDFLRFCNPGWTAKALRPSGNGVLTRGQVALDAFLKQLEGYYGTVDVPLQRIFIGGFLRGAFVAELVPDDAGRMPIDLATPDPASIRFRRRTDPVRGPVWEPFQYQWGEIVSLERPTIRYVPIDPLPGHPEGRSPAAPALFPALFLIALLHDLRRVVQQQGWPRLDVAISLEKLKAALPEYLQNDLATFESWVKDATAQVEKTYASLKPDDTYIHTDVVTVNRPVGAVDASSLGAVDGLIAAIERQTMRALKSNSLLMETADASGSDTASIRKWEVHAQGIKSIQHPVETMLSSLLTMAMEMQGIQCKVEFRFAELRASEMLRDEQTKTLKQANAAFAYQQGWYSQEQAALEGAGVEKPDAPEPRSTSTPSVGAIATANPEPGSVQ